MRRKAKVILLLVLTGTVGATGAWVSWMASAEQGGARDGESEAVGAWVRWEALREPEQQHLECDPAGRWLAVRDTWGCRLRVWRLGPERELAELLLDTKGSGYIVREAEWAASRLVLWRIDGIDDAIDFDANPPENASEFVTQHTSIVSWDARTGDTGVIARKRGELLLASQTGKHLALFNVGPKSTDWTVTVYETTDFGTKASFVLSEEPDYWGRLLPMCWAADEEHIFITTQARVDEASTRGYGANWQILLVTDLTGQLEPLANATDTRLWGTGSFGVSPTWWVLDGGELNVTPVEEGRLVACTLAPRGNTLTRLGFFDTSGLVRAYPLEREWYYGPKELRQDKQAMQTITITPDGRRLILQETDADSSLDYGEKGWVWAWDYQTRQAQRLAYVPEIRATFGWVQEQYLMVETRGTIEGTAPLRWTTNDYGVLYVPPAEDEGK